MAHESRDVDGTLIAFMWLRGLLVRRTARIAGVAAGVTLAVALFAVLGSFVSSSAASMSRRAVESVPVDWQLELVPGADAAAVIRAVRATGGVLALQSVGYAKVAGFSAQTQASKQTTGAGFVVGVGANYRKIFNSEILPLVGRASGAALLQQTAANLHVTAGNTVAISRLGLKPVSLKIDGVVTMPNADSFFQAIGVPAGSAPQAPPDNVLIVPLATWHRLFDRQAVVRPDSIRMQLHIRLARDLPGDPGAAYTRVHERANNVEVRIAGRGITGDNLSARLLGARADALYARVLFLFLGIPGVVLAAVLTFVIAAAGSERRGAEQALLQIRGASTAAILRLSAAEGAVAGIVGAVAGALVARPVAALVAQAASATQVSLWWILVAVAGGLALAIAAVTLPSWKLARAAVISATKTSAAPPSTPWWQRAYADVILLAAAAVSFWFSAASGYQIVLAPEGVPTAAVSYDAFIAPLFLWLGAALLIVRLGDAMLARGGSVLRSALRALAGRLAQTVAAAVRRQRRLLTRGIVFAALGISFAVSTSLFNTTYAAQSRVDAELTNGADVLVSGTGANPPSAKLTAFASLPGVALIEPMQHRLAYVGNDLQDLYGIDPVRIGQLTSLSNAYFGSHDAAGTMRALAAKPDGVLVAQETARDFQLSPGDRLNLRLQSGRDHRYHIIPFSFVDVVREFPTAPRDSFLVANASYVARATHSSGAEILLIKTRGDQRLVAQRARVVAKSIPGSVVSDIGSAQRRISSGLTAIDVRALSVIELTFAALCVAAATGLIIALGISERRRMFVILWALGAKRRQLGAFWWSEAMIVTIGGAVAGTILGFGIGYVLVKLLTGVFDPPPERLAIPVGYLVLLLAIGAASTVAAVVAAQMALRHPSVRDLRDL